MAEQIVSPDLNFVKEVIAAGADSLKKCYQCSTCTVVCEVTQDKKPFPRKEMLYAQWGMKDQLMTNPDIWLCHQCSDCTAYCPRGAKPGEVLGAVRKVAIKEYSAPRFLAELTADPKYMLLLFAIPIVIFLGILGAIGHLDLSAIELNPDGKIAFPEFIPDIYVDIVMVPTAAFAALVFVLGVTRYWSAMAAGMGGVTGGDLFASIKDTLIDIFTHKKFGLCGVSKERKISHLLVFYSFIGLAITTSLGVFYVYGLKWEMPYPQTNILKIIGNSSAIGLLVGITYMITNRMKNQAKSGIGSYFDWFLIAVIFGVCVTGILAEVVRLANASVFAYIMYFAHLVFIFVLFAYAPFSKMAHMVYRTMAMVFARHAGRE
jgi:quinone-modifying oxidoreductase subunit QmoC